MANERSIEFLDAKTGEQNKNCGVVDVVKSYPWTVSNVELAREECPRIIIKERQQTTSSIRQSMEYLVTQGRAAIGGKSIDPYYGLYQVDENIIGNTYIFPYYNPYHHYTANAWGENKGSISEVVSKGLGAIVNAGKVLFPSAGIEGAKSWEGSTPAQYSFTFQLLNTVSWEKTAANRKLIKALISNNLLDKMDLIAIRPPAICFVNIPGMRGRTVAVMSAIEVKNIGQLNFYNSDSLKQLGEFGINNYTDVPNADIDSFLPETAVNIPDAYEITINIQELITESRQIFADKIGKVFATVKSPPQDLNDALKDPRGFINQFGN